MSNKKQSMSKRHSSVSKKDEGGSASITSKIPNILPGLSYLPDPVEMYEDAKMRHKVVAEFVDFLDCVTDLLHLVRLTTERHLRSPRPLPCDVIREMCTLHSVLGGRSQRFQATLTTPRHTLARQSVKPLMLRGKRTMPTGEKTHRDLQEITGRNRMPIWQMVMQEKEACVVHLEYEMTKSRRTRGNKQSDASISALGQDRMRAMVDKIKMAQSLGVRASKPSHQRQVDMMLAYFHGFKSISEYKTYLEEQEEHWFTRILYDATDYGLLKSLHVVRAYERLSQFYHFSDALAKAKLCYITQSVPIWDVARMTFQRAVEFILGPILNVGDPTKTLIGWLRARDLTYVILPPIVGFFSLNNASESETGESTDDTQSRQKAFYSSEMAPDKLHHVKL